MIGRVYVSFYLSVAMSVSLCRYGYLSVLRKEGNVLFNDVLNTFYLRLYGVRHMAKNYSDNERGNPLPATFSD